MTLIAHSLNHKIPSIVGDILISSTERQMPFFVPTRPDDISFHLNEEGRKLYPSRFAQKTYIIRANLCIAMSGSVFEMKNFLVQLKLRCQYYNDVDFTREHFEKFMEDFNMAENFSESSVFAMLIDNLPDQSIYVHQMSYGNWQQTETLLFDSTGASGSGTSTYLKWIQEDVLFESSHEQGDAAYAIHTNNCLIGRLLAIERASIHTLKMNWGAGYELVFYDGANFFKCNSLCFVQFRGDFDEEGDLKELFPDNIIYNKYVEDVLVITSIEMQGGDYSDEKNLMTYHAHTTKTRLFQVPTIDNYREFSFDELSNTLSFNTNECTISYILLKDGESIFIPVIYVRDSSVEINYRQEESLSIKLPISFCDRIRNLAKERFSRI